jgi:hypothetical protein
LKSPHLAAAFCILATATLAHDYRIGDLLVEHPMAFATPATAQTGGGYVTITNTGTQDDMLLAVEADFPRVMLHNTVMTDDIARMEHLETIPLPAGETVMLMPGGMHVMFMGLNGDPFEVGEAIPATLIFEKAGPLDIVFDVEDRSDDGEMDHSGH